MRKVSDESKEKMLNALNKLYETEFFTKRSISPRVTKILKDGGVITVVNGGHTGRNVVYKWNTIAPTLKMVDEVFKRIQDDRRKQREKNNQQPKQNTEQIKRPPIGLPPRWLYEETRRNEIGAAVYRYIVDGDQEIPVEWIQEYNELIRNKKS